MALGFLFVSSFSTLCLPLCFCDSPILIFKMTLSKFLFSKNIAETSETMNIVYFSKDGFT